MLSPRLEKLTRDDLEMLVTQHLIDREVAVFAVQYMARHKRSPDKRMVETFKAYVLPEARRKAKEAAGALARQGILSKLTDLTLIGYLAAHLTLLVNAAKPSVVPPDLLAAILSPVNILLCGGLTLVALFSLARK